MKPISKFSLPVSLALVAFLPGSISHAQDYASEPVGQFTWLFADPDSVEVSGEDGAFFGNKLIIKVDGREVVRADTDQWWVIVEGEIRRINRTLVVAKTQGKKVSIDLGKIHDFVKTAQDDERDDPDWGLDTAVTISHQEIEKQELLTLDQHILRTMMSNCGECALDRRASGLVSVVRPPGAPVGTGADRSPARSSAVPAK